MTLEPGVIPFNAILIDNLRCIIVRGCHFLTISNEKCLFILCHKNVYLQFYESILLRSPEHNVFIDVFIL